MAVGIVLLLGGYVLSYTALLDPGEFGEGGAWSMPYCRVPAYRAGGDFAAAAFRPAVWVDRQVRPGYWAWRVEEWSPD